MLRANRTVGNAAAAQSQAQPTAPVTPAAPPTAPAAQEQQAYQAPAQEQAYQAPAPAYQPPVAPPARAVSKPSEAAILNAGILEGIEDMGTTGNFVTIDGTNFLYKASNETVPYIDMVIGYGKRFYQYVDETDPNNKKFYNADTKLDQNYKLKFELKWQEEREEGEEPTEFTTTLSTTSTMNFMEYFKGLSKLGFAVNAVGTRMTGSRQVSKDGKNRYSRVEFEAFDLAAYEQGQYVTIGVKTPNAVNI